MLFSKTKNIFVRAAALIGLPIYPFTTLASHMNNQTFLFYYLRDIDKTIAEIEAFELEADLWKIQGNITNSAGNLALHLAGNLQHFIGHFIGQTGYIRNRPYEFSARNVPRTEVVQELRNARSVVETVLGNLTPEDWQRTFPGDHHFGEQGTIMQGLLHLLAHLNYHLGQINYLRRL